MELLNILFVLFFVLENKCVVASGKLELKFKNFRNPTGQGSNGHCCDGKYFFCPAGGGCDHYFKVCIDSYSGSGCRLGSKTTGALTDTNSKTFGNNVGGTANPMIFSFTSFQGSGVKVEVKVMDEDSNSDDHVDTIVKKVQLTPSKSVFQATTHDLYLMHRVHVRLELIVYCNPYYYGPRCDTYCHPRDNVYGHYTCDQNSGARLCRSGWTGRYCRTNIDECVSQPCHNGGSCKDGVDAYRCMCMAGFTGSRCETNINDCSPTSCRNGGTCIDGVNRFTCRCVKGFTGVKCERNINDCRPSSCNNRGTCLDGLNRFRCFCEPGFIGNQCETNEDDCQEQPCLNGQCIDGVASYSCVCDQGWTGANCEDVIESNTTTASPSQMTEPSLAVSTYDLAYYNTTNEEDESSSRMFALVCDIITKESNITNGSLIKDLSGCQENLTWNDKCAAFTNISLALASNEEFVCNKSVFNETLSQSEHCGEYLNLMTSIRDIVEIACIHEETFENCTRQCFPLEDNYDLQNNRSNSNSPSNETSEELDKLLLCMVSCNNSQFNVENVTPVTTISSTGNSSTNITCEDCTTASQNYTTDTNGDSDWNTQNSSAGTTLDTNTLEVYNMSTLTPSDISVNDTILLSTQDSLMQNITLVLPTTTNSPSNLSKPNAQNEENVIEDTLAMFSDNTPDEDIPCALHFKGELTKSDESLIMDIIMDAVANGLEFSRKDIDTTHSIEICMGDDLKAATLIFFQVYYKKHQILCEYVKDALIDIGEGTYLDLFPFPVFDGTKCISDGVSSMMQKSSTKYAKSNIWYIVVPVLIITIALLAIGVFVLMKRIRRKMLKSPEGKNVRESIYVDNPLWQDNTLPDTNSEETDTVEINAETSSPHGFENAAYGLGNEDQAIESKEQEPNNFYHEIVQE